MTATKTKAKPAEQEQAEPKRWPTIFDKLEERARTARQGAGLEYQFQDYSAPDRYPHVINYETGLDDLTADVTAAFLAARDEVHAGAAAAAIVARDRLDDWMRRPVVAGTQNPPGAPPAPVPPETGEEGDGG